MHCSPFHRNLFLSCGADGTIAVYNLLQSKPLLTLDPSPTYILSVSWSLVRPLVFAATDESGSTFIYDLGRSTSKPVAQVHSAAGAGDVLDPDGTASAADESKASMDGDHRGHSRRAATACVAFNPRQRALFATGNASGSVHLWRLPATLSTSLANETGLLENLGKALEDGDATAAAKAKAKARAAKVAKAKSKTKAKARGTKDKKRPQAESKASDGGGGGGGNQLSKSRSSRRRFWVCSTLTMPGSSRNHPSS